MEGIRTVGSQDWRNSGLEGFRTGGIQDWRDAGKGDSGKEECRKGGMYERRMQERRDI